MADFGTFLCPICGRPERVKKKAAVRFLLERSPLAPYLPELPWDATLVCIDCVNALEDQRGADARGGER